MVFVRNNISNTSFQKLWFQKVYSHNYKIQKKISNKWFWYSIPSIFCFKFLSVYVSSWDYLSFAQKKKIQNCQLLQLPHIPTSSLLLHHASLTAVIFLYWERYRILLQKEMPKNTFFQNLECRFTYLFGSHTTLVTSFF